MGFGGAEQLRRLSQSSCCYRPEPFPSDRHRVEYLFALYEQITAPLVATEPARKGRRQQAAY